MYNKTASSIEMCALASCARLRPVPSLVDQILQYCSDGTLRRVKLFARAEPDHAGHRSLYTACTYEYMRRVHYALQKYALQP